MWVPIDDAAAMWLPSRRSFTKLEALFSLQKDYRDRRPASARGYEVLWRWGRRRVVEFLQEVGVEIVGQKGRKPGHLQPQHHNNTTTNDTATNTATTPQIFRDFGQIGSLAHRNSTTNEPAPASKTTYNYIDILDNNRDREEEAPHVITSI